MSHKQENTGNGTHIAVVPLPWTVWFTRLASPRQWSLRARILYVSGLLLALGCAFQVVFLSMVLNESVQSLADKRLVRLKSTVLSELANQRRTAMSHSLSLASMDTIQQGMARGDSESLQAFCLPYSDGLRMTLNMNILDIFLIGPGREVYLRTDRPNARGPAVAHDALLEEVERELRTASGLESMDGRLFMRAMSPVILGNEFVGVVELRMDMEDVLESLEIGTDEGVAVYVRDEAAGEDGSLADGEAPADPVPSWALLLAAGSHPSDGLDPENTGQDLARVGDTFHLTVPLAERNRGTASLLVVSYDASVPVREGSNRIFQLGGLFIPGALFLWILLYLNVARIESFLAQLKRIVVASHSNDFKTRFEIDTVHCLELMNCHNEDCPVYQDPTRVCYLETGSEAISPRWRNTCLFLKRYGHCRNCPVYARRRGDEIEEMRGVVNTLMRLWSKFLGRTGHLLAYVLRSQEQAGRLPSLDEVSQRLEQMAKLTFFSHDLQGTLNKDEVYLQLSHVVRENFLIDHFLLFSFDHEGGHGELALDEAGPYPLCRNDVLVAPELCRANRVAEEVTSFHNPALCPYFNCDVAREFRVCLPMVMNGKVGGVFSSVLPRDRWSELSGNLPMLRKYLAEASPVLSSLRLLDLSREQTLRDPLTGCHNRRFLDEFISKYEPMSEREGRRTGFLMCDLDYFKQVNDQHGHDAGDVVLKQVVAVIRGAIRRSDLVVRYGGEEFLVLLQDVQEGAACRVAEKIRSGVEQELIELPGGETLHKTISVGVAEYPTDGDTLYKAIKFADVALYEAKNRGRNRVQQFEPSMWEGKEY